MAVVVFAAAAGTAIERYISEADVEGRAARAAALRSAAAFLGSHPLAGRALEHGLHELVVSHGAAGAVVLYRFAVEADEVRVLALAGQREMGYRP